MHCQFTSLRKGNIIIRCFEQAAYHVSHAPSTEHNYCLLHIQKLPRKTKLELLIDVIDFLPDTSVSQCVNDPFACSMSALNRGVEHLSQSDTDTKTVLASAESIASISGFMSGSINEHDSREAKPNVTFSKASKKVTFSRPFVNLGQVCETYGYLPRPKTWRMLPLAIPGEINGLHNMRGLAIATNGIHVAIENSACTELYIGHLEWFIVDDLNAPASARDVLKQAAENTFRVVKSQLKQFDEIFD